MFIILSYYRSGTHLLASLLNSHPDLTCYDEIYASKRAHQLVFGKKDFNEIKDNEGFILMYNHYLTRNNGERPIIRQQKIIHLVRENLENQAKSMVTPINKARKKVDFYRRMTFRDKFENIFELSYEQMCADKSIDSYRNDELLKFLGVKPMLLTTDFVKGKDPQFT